MRAELRRFVERQRDRFAFHLQSLPGQVFPKLYLPIEVTGRGTHLPVYEDAGELVEAHFARRSECEHASREGLEIALKRAAARPAVILETGSAAWGADSTLLFDAYVRSFGGQLFSTDIRIQPLLRMVNVVSCRTRLSCDDSVRFLERWVASWSDRKADLVYLDSHDLNPSRPYDAAVHALREYLAVRPAIKRGTILIVDDSPNTLSECPSSWRQEAKAFFDREGRLPGKGMLIACLLEGDERVTKLSHKYQLVYEFR